MWCEEPGSRYLQQGVYHGHSDPWSRKCAGEAMVFWRFEMGWFHHVFQERSYTRRALAGERGSTGQI